MERRPQAHLQRTGPSPSSSNQTLQWVGALPKLRKEGFVFASLPAELWWLHKDVQRLAKAPGSFEGLLRLTKTQHGLQRTPKVSKVSGNLRPQKPCKDSEML